MEKQELDAFVGQAIADAVVRDAMLITLMELLPQFDTRLLAKVLVADLDVRGRLPEQYVHAYQERLQEIRWLMTQARQTPDGTT